MLLGSNLIDTALYFPCFPKQTVQSKFFRSPHLSQPRIFSKQHNCVSCNCTILEVKVNPLEYFALYWLLVHQQILVTSKLLDTWGGALRKFLLSSESARIFSLSSSSPWYPDHGADSFEIYCSGTCDSFEFRTPLKNLLLSSFALDELLLLLVEISNERRLGNRFMQNCKI